MTAAPWTIRPYRDSDKSGCRACVVELQEAERLIDERLRPGESMADEYLLDMHGRCRDNAGTILVADTGTGIVGLVMVLTRVPFTSLDDPPGDYALIADLVVCESHRGRGLGAALLDAAEQLARDAGAPELRIGVLTGNDSARRLYARRGFASYLETLSKGLRSD